MVGTGNIYASENAVAFTDSLLRAGTCYLYRVRAVNVGGFSAYSNEAAATTTAP